MVTAAVLHAMSEDLEVHDDIEQAPPGPGEVKIKVVASGVCHSDLSVQNGTIPLPHPDRARPRGRRHRRGGRRGRHRRSPSATTSCCRSCRLRRLLLLQARPGLPVREERHGGGRRAARRHHPLHPRRRSRSRQMAMLGTFGNYAIVPEISAVKIDDDVDLRYAALIGCGVLTGVGAALNTANIRKGDTVAVIGCGGVGLNVIQGAKIAGADEDHRRRHVRVEAEDGRAVRRHRPRQGRRGRPGRRGDGPHRGPRRRRGLRGHRPRPHDRADDQHDPPRRRGDPRRRAPHGRHART